MIEVSRAPGYLVQAKNPSLNPFVHVFSYDALYHEPPMFLEFLTQHFVSASGARPYVPGQYLTEPRTGPGIRFSVEQGYEGYPPIPAVEGEAVTAAENRHD
jgi:hypothetical protein